MVAIDRGNPYLNIVFMCAEISSLATACFGKLLYIIHINSKPVNPAIRKDTVYPIVAPKAPNPRITNEGIRTVLIID